MKNSLFPMASLLLAMFLSTGCESSNPNDNNEKVGLKTETGTETKGNLPMGDRTDVEGTFDFNGDGKLESCYLLEPKKNEEDMECEGDCNCLIMFSDSDIPPIDVPGCIGGDPEFFGDLDGNGTCEIGIWPFWWTSCWHTYYIYTFVDGGWSFFVEPITVHCNLMEELEESGEPIIKPVSGKDNLFEIKYSEFDIDEGILTLTKTVKALHQ